MTELQMGLIGLGAFAVIGVVAYNKWQEMRQRKQAEQALKASLPDVLLDEVPHVEFPPLSSAQSEPTEAGMAPTQEAAANEQFAPVIDPVSASERIEPVLRIDPDPEELLPPDVEQCASAESEAPAAEPVPDAIASKRAPSAAVEVAAPKGRPSEDSRLLSPQVDFIAVIDAVEPVPAQRILDAQRQTLERVRKPVRWIGYNEESNEWESVSGTRGGEYRYIRAGLQLVNRQGPVTENDLAIFSVAMQDLADQLMGILELPPRQPAYEAAAKLDHFCASVDIQIGINVISQGQAFQGTKLRALAEAAGMTIDSGKRFVRRDEDGNVLYVLLNQDASGFSSETMKTMSTHGLTFLLDVPCVAHGDRVFNQMVDQARRFADVLHGVLVDDNRRPLSESALEPIRKQIGQYQTMLAAQHLPAGSPLTQRLFS